MKGLMLLIKAIEVLSFRKSDALHNDMPLMAGDLGDAIGHIGNYIEQFGITELELKQWHENKKQLTEMLPIIREIIKKYTEGGLTVIEPDDIGQLSLVETVLNGLSLPEEEEGEE